MHHHAPIRKQRVKSADGLTWLDFCACGAMRRMTFAGMWGSTTVLLDSTGWRAIITVARCECGAVMRTADAARKHMAEHPDWKLIATCECCGEPAGEGGALCPACQEAR